MIVLRFCFVFLLLPVFLSLDCAGAFANPVGSLADVHLLDSASYNLALVADQAGYAVGDQARVTVSLYNLPENPGYEFFVSTTYNGADLPLTPITNTELYAVTPALALGTSQVVASLFLQNKAEAASLQQSIGFYSSEIARLTILLGQTTDPAQRAAIQAQIAQDQKSLNATMDHLSHVRTPIGAPVGLALTAQ